MTSDRFRFWLDNLVRIWVMKKPDEVVNLVADTFIWYDAPFETPIETKENLLKEWQVVLNHDDVEVVYKIEVVEKDVAFAHWHATFTRLPSHEKTELEGIYKVVLNEEGKCTEFHQWYNAK